MARKLHATHEDYLRRVHTFLQLVRSQTSWIKVNYLLIIQTEQCKL